MKDQLARDLYSFVSSITSAGLALDKPFLDHTWEESRRILDINVSAVF